MGNQQRQNRSARQGGDTHTEPSVTASPPTTAPFPDVFQTEAVAGDKTQGPAEHSGTSGLFPKRPSAHILQFT